ncbi:hypothetical protein QAD02_020700, partial [Eretmocerus hayati]
HERARVIYKYALERITNEKNEGIFKAYAIHEKKFGDRINIEDAVVNKRKYQYEQEIRYNPCNYDAWFDYLKLIELEGNIEMVRENYEKAIANIPPTEDKKFWRRYIYLWISYAVFEELVAGDVPRTRQIY